MIALRHAKIIHSRKHVSNTTTNHGADRAITETRVREIRQYQFAREEEPKMKLLEVAQIEGRLADSHYAIENYPVNGIILPK